MLKIFRHIIIYFLFYSLKVWAEPQLSKITEYAPEYTPNDVAIFDEENKQHFLEEYEGKTVLLVFWATWCSPCTSEMPDLDALQKDFRKLSFLILPVSQDYTGIGIVKEFYKTYNLRHLAMLHDYKNILFKSFGIVGLPTSVLINHEGMAVAKFTGSINWYDEKVRETLLKYIPGNPAIPKNSYKDNSLNHAPIMPYAEEKENDTKQPKIENIDEKHENK